MNAPIKLAQTAAQPAAAPPKVIRLEMPADGRAVVIQTGYDGKIQLDFSAIADKRITLVRVGERAIIYFHDNKSTIELDPFFDSLGRPLPFEFVLGPGRIFTAEQIAELLPFSVYQGILPAAGEDGDPQDAGANFDPAIIAELPPVILNELLLEEFLPGIEFLADRGLALLEDGPEPLEEPLLFDGAGLFHDETPGINQSTDVDGALLVPFDGGLSAISALFAVLTTANGATPGLDPDVPLDNGAIGFAISGIGGDPSDPQPIVTVDPPAPGVTRSFALQTTDGIFSGVQTTEGVDIFLYNGTGALAGYILGRLGSGGPSEPGAGTPDAAGVVAFALVADPATGVVYLAHYLSILHDIIDPADPLEHDELKTLATDVVQIVVTDTNGAESISASLFIGHLIGFEDDGPAVTADPEATLALAMDESVGTTGSSQNEPGETEPDDETTVTLPLALTTLGAGTVIGAATADGANLFITPDFGSDGPSATVAPVYALTDALGNAILDETPSGLTDTASGNPIFLFVSGDLILGRVGNDDDTPNAAGAIAFAIHIDSSSGQVSTAQFRAVVHGDPTDHDENGEGDTAEPATLSVDIHVTLTVTDGDGDTASATSQAAIAVNFEDDGPAVTADETATLALTMDESVGTTGSSQNEPGETEPDDETTVTLPLALTTLGAGTVIGAATADGANLFITPDFGSDGPSATVAPVYALTDALGNAIADETPSGLTDTASGNLIFLFVSGDLILGRVGNDDDTPNAAGAIAFAIHIDSSSGQVSTAQFRAVVHGDPTDHDENGEGDTAEPATLSVDIHVTLTVTDGDGDTASATSQAAIAVNFEDDGPAVTADETATLALTMDESVGTTGSSQNEPGETEPDDETTVTLPLALTTLGAGTVIGAATANGANLFITPDFGSDGPSATVAPVYALTDALGNAIVDETPSGLTDTASGNLIFLFVNGNLILGRVGNDDDTPNAAGAIAFAIHIDGASGQVSTAQFRAVVHGDPTDHDENGEGDTAEPATLSVDIHVTLTVTDGDGDTASATSQAAIAVNFEDDGPAVTADETATLALTMDESVGTTGSSQNEPGETEPDDETTVTLPLALTTLGAGTVIGAATADGANLFITPDFGSDGPSATVAPVYALTDALGNAIADETPSGLTDTASGNPIFLFVSGDLILGRVGNDDDTPNAAGAIAFAIHIDSSSGQVSTAQFRAVVHGDPTDHDENGEGDTAEPATLSVDIHVTLTVTDGDGDTASATSQAAIAVNFEDDGPAVTADETATLALTMDESVGTTGSSQNEPGETEPDDETTVTLPLALTTLGAGTVIGAATADGANLFITPDFGSDGPSATVAPVYALTDALGNAIVDETPSGLTDTASGNLIFLFVSGDLILGRVGNDDDTPNAAGAIAFAIHIDSSSGQVSTAQFRAVVHGDPTDHDENGEGDTAEPATLSVDIHVTLTVTDGDGDTASATSQAAIAVNFEDDGPAVTADETATLALTMDESVGTTGSSQNEPGETEPDDETTVTLPLALTTLGAGTVIGAATADGANLFITPDFGSDGPSATVAPVYALTDALGNAIADETPSGLTDTASGNLIFLFVSGDLILGRVGNDDDTPNAAGAIAFAIHIDSSSGQVSTAQFRAVVHGDPTDHDENGEGDTAEPATLSVDIHVTLTVTDGDGDTASATSQAAIAVNFEDDGPGLTGEAPGALAVDEGDIVTDLSEGTSPNDGESDGSVTGGPADGADGPAYRAGGSLASQVDFGSDGPAEGGGFGFAANAIASMDALGLKSKSAELEWQITGNVLEGVADGRTVITFTLNGDGTWEYRQFDQLDHVPPPPGTPFDYNTQLIGAGGPLESIDFGAAIVATDGDGDSVSLPGRLMIEVRDDVPVNLGGGECIEIELPDLGGPGILFFRAVGDGTIGRELFVYDSTLPSPPSNNGSLLVHDLNGGGGHGQGAPQGIDPPFDNIGINNGPHPIGERMLVHGGKLYMAADDGTSTGTELYVYDPANHPGPSLVLAADMNSVGAGNSNPQWLIGVGNLIYMAAETGAAGTNKELIAFDPSTGSFAVVGDNNIRPTWLTELNGILYFAADGTTAQGRELFFYDPANPGLGIQLAANINTGQNADSNPEWFAVFQGKLYFSATDGAGNQGQELWVYTPGGTAEIVADINPGGGPQGQSNPKWLTVFDDKLYFVADDGGGTGMQLFVFDPANVGVGNDGVDPVFTTGVVPTDARWLTVYDGKLYFAADGDGFVQQLWEWDGSGAPVRLSELHQTGSFSGSVSYLAVMDGKLYFSAHQDQGAHQFGRELFSYDPVNGVVLVSDVRVGATSSNPQFLTPFGGSSGGFETTFDLSALGVLIKVGTDDDIAFRFLNSEEALEQLASDNAGLTANGVPIVFEVNTEGNLLTARAGPAGPVVFTVSLDVDGTGIITFFQNLDVPPDGLHIHLGSIVGASDHDGDGLTLDADQFCIEIPGPPLILTAVEAIVEEDHLGHAAQQPDGDPQFLSLGNEEHVQDSTNMGPGIPAQPDLDSDEDVPPDAASDFNKISYEAMGSVASSIAATFSLVNVVAGGPVAVTYSSSFTGGNPETLLSKGTEVYFTLHEDGAGSDKLTATSNAVALGSKGLDASMTLASLGFVNGEQVTLNSATFDVTNAATQTLADLIAALDADPDATVMLDAFGRLRIVGADLADSLALGTDSASGFAGLGVVASIYDPRTILTLEVDENGDYRIALFDQLDHHPFDEADHFEDILTIDLDGLIQATAGSQTATVDFSLDVIDDVPVNVSEDVVCLEIELPFLEGGPGVLYFVADGGPGIGIELYRLVFDENGVPSAELVQNINMAEGGAGNAFPTDADKPLQFFMFDGTIYFVAQQTGPTPAETVGWELYRINPITGVVQLVEDERPGNLGTDGANFVEFNGAVYFIGLDTANNNELFRLNANNTIDNLDINTDGIPTPIRGSNPAELTLFGDSLFFTAQHFEQGRELWRVKSDGSIEQIIIRAGGDGSDPEHLTVFNNALYFAANNGTGGVELYRALADGSVSLVSDVNLGVNASNPQNFHEFNGALYFTATSTNAAGFGNIGHELFRVTAGGVVEKVPNLPGDANGINAGNGGAFTSSIIPNFTEFNGELYFAAQSTGAAGGFGQIGTELFKVGADGVVRLVANINSGSADSNPGNFFVFNGALYFIADDGPGEARELHRVKSDGSVEVVRFGGLAGTPLENAGNYIIFNGALYLTADGGAGVGIEIWRITGSGGEAYTVELISINPGGGSSMSSEFNPDFYVFGDSLYFGANNGNPANGNELFRITAANPTTAVLVDDIWDGEPGHSIPHGFFLGGGGGSDGFATPFDLAALGVSIAAGADEDIAFRFLNSAESLAQLAADNQGLTVNGVPVTFEVNAAGNLLTAKAGNAVAFIVSLDLDGTGIITFFLNLDVPPDGLHIHLGSILTASDYDGDSLLLDADQFCIEIEAPPVQLVSDGLIGIVEEEHLRAGLQPDDFPYLSTGNEDATSTPDGDDDVDPNPDQGGETDEDFDVTTHRFSGEISVAGGTGPYTFALRADWTPIVLSSKGEPVLFDIDTATGVLTGYVDSGTTDPDNGALDDDDRVVLRLTLSPVDADSAQLTFTLYDQIDHHPVPDADHVEDIDELDFSGLVRATDTGSGATLDIGSVIIRVIDDIPVVTDAVYSETIDLSGLGGPAVPAFLYLGADGGGQNQGNIGRELWSYDQINDPAVHERLADFRGGDPSYITPYGGLLFMALDTNIGSNENRELVSWDGFNFVTIDVRPGNGSSNPEWLAVIDGKLYFGARGEGNFGRELHVYDGSTFTRLSDINSGGGSSDPRWITEFDNRVFFTAQSGDGSGTNRELWSYNPSGGALTQYNINPSDDSNPDYLTLFKGKLYFFADSGDGAGRELYVYDPGTDAVTRVSDVNPNGNSREFDDGTHVDNNGANHRMAVIGDYLYFTAASGPGVTNNNELYRYDGVTVTLAADINTGGPSSNAEWLTVFNGKLYFAANAGPSPSEFGVELYEYNPANGQVTRITDINVGGDIHNSNPAWLAVIGDKLYFAATTGAGGTQNNELWVYDPNNPDPGLRVRLVYDFNTDAGANHSGNPRWLTPFGGSPGGGGSVSVALDLDGLVAVGADEDIFWSLLGDTDGLEAQGLSSDDVDLTYEVVGNTLTAYAGGTPVFQLILNSDGTGVFTVFAPIDGTDQPGFQIDFSSIVQARDFDGDAVPLGAGQFFIEFAQQTNAAPFANEPQTALSTQEDFSLLINSFSIGDPDDTTLTLKLTATSTITLSTVAGLIFSVGDGIADTTMTFSGMISAINAALNGMTYNPTGDFNGTGKIAYVIDDGTNTTNGEFDIDVTSVNDAPVAGDDALSSIDEDSETRIISFASLLGNDSAGPANESGQSLTITAVSNMVGGVAVINGTNIEFTPDADFYGTASFDYTVQDNGQTNGVDDFKSDTGSVSFEVTAVNDAPTTTPVTLAAIEEDSSGRLITQAELLANANDVDGDTLEAINLAISSGNGTLVDNLDGTWTYTPALDDDTDVTFSYEVTDNIAAPVAATATLDITPLNDAPTTTPVTLAAIEEDSGGRLITQAELLANANDVDGDTIEAINLAISSGLGSLVDNGNGTWTYTPALDDDTDVSFSYEITDGTVSLPTTASLDITPLNDAPTTTLVTLAAIEEDSGGRIITQAELLANANDVDGDTLEAINLAISSGNGSLVDNLNGTWTYTPADDDDTDVTFSYEVTDNIAAPVAATASLDITPVNDAPTTTPVTLAAIEEDSGGRLITQAELLANANDVDGDTLEAINLAISSGLGSLVDNLDGTWTYTPALDDDTDVTFSYEVTDNIAAPVPTTATLDITPVNDAPELDLDASAGGTGFAVSFSEGDGPVAIADSDMSIIDVDDADMESATITLTNPQDGADEFLSIDTGLLPSGITVHGSSTSTMIVLTGTASKADYETAIKLIRYENNSENPGTVARIITASVNDGDADSNDGAATIAVISINDAPTAQAGTGAGNEDAPALIQVTLNGSDVDGTVAGFIVKSLPANGKLWKNANSTDEVFIGNMVTSPLWFAPDADWSGTTEFEYSAVDNENLESVNIATATIDVAPVADAPVINIGPVIYAGDGTPEPLGGEFQVNTTNRDFTNSDNGFPTVATLEGGGFVVAWVESNPATLRFQRYDEDGLPVGGEITIGSGANPSIAPLAGGGFVLTWHTGSEVFGRIYNDAGVLQGGTFQVNTFTTNDQSNASIVTLKDGGFVIVWRSQGQDPGDSTSGGNQWGVYGQRYDADGNPVPGFHSNGSPTTGNGEFKVSTFDGGNQQLASIAALEDGGFVVAWQTSLGPLGTVTFQDIAIQRFSATGAPVGGEQFVQLTPGSQIHPAIVGLKDGGYVVVWQSANPIGAQTDSVASTELPTGTGYGIFGQRYDANGNKVGATEFQVNTFTSGHQQDASLLALSDGGFLVSWMSGDGDGNGIFAQRYDANGNKVGGEFLVNQTTAGPQNQSGQSGGWTMTELANGVILTSWYGAPLVPAGPFDHQQIYARLFSLPGLGLPSITVALADTDGSESLVLVLSGFPEGGTFSVGALDPLDPIQWLIDDPAEIAALATAPFTFTPPAGWSGTFTLTVTAVVTDSAVLSDSNTHTDTASAAVTFDVTVNALPTDIQWNAVPPAAGNALPAIGATLANLSATDLDHSGAQLTYSLVSSSHAIFEVSASGVVTATGAMVAGTTYELAIKVTDQAGGGYTETFNIIAGTTAANNPLPTGGAAAAILAGDDAVYGINGNDNIFGGDGDDSLFGQDGGDTLTGGTGNDLLFGGAGNDAYEFAAAGDGDDTIVELAGEGTDTIRILTAAGGATVFSNLHLSRVDADSDSEVDDLLIEYNGSTITVLNQFTATATEGVESLEFSNGGTFLGHSFGTGTYTFSNIGGNGQRVMVMTDAGESFSPGSAADILFAGGGDDTIGINIGHGGDFIDGGSGFDTVRFVGTGSANTLEVTLSGGVIVGMEGGLFVNVEAFEADLAAGADTLVYVGTSEAVSVNLSTGAATGFTSIVNIENVTGGSGDDTLIGDGNANVLDGNGGVDTLLGGGGDDTIYLSGFGDVFHGGDGNDTLRLGSIAGGSANAQMASFSRAATSIETISSVGGNPDVALQGTGDGNVFDFTGVSLSNIDVIMGGGDDTVVTSASHSNSGSGADGISAYVGGDGIDTITLNFTISQFDTLLQNATMRGALHTYIQGPTGLTYTSGSLTGWQNVTASEFESAKLAVEVTQVGGGSKSVDISHVFGGAQSPLAIPTAQSASPSADLIVGSNAAGSPDNILADAGNDVVFGLNGADTLNGGTGHDLLFGGGNNDTLIGGEGRDVLVGGTGVDNFRYISTADGGPSIDDADLILDFGDGADIFQILQSGAGFVDGGLATGSQAAVFGKSADATFGSATERFHYDTSTSTLWYDSDGNGGAQAIALARLENGFDLQGNQIQVIV